MIDLAPPPESPRSNPNLFVTFWGIQGSCPICPGRDELADYAARTAAAAIQKAMLELAEQMEQGRCTTATLRGLAADENAAEYARSLEINTRLTYGGDTTCVEVQTADGQTLLFDMGTGMRNFSKRLLSRPPSRDRTIHVFASHEHLDHRNGLAFSSLCFERENPFTLNIYGTRECLAALDDRYGIFSHRLTSAMHVDDPLDFQRIAAKFTATEIQPDRNAAKPDLLPFGGCVLHVNEPIAIGNTTVTPFEVYHGMTRCLAYCVLHGGSKFIFCTDHELRHGNNPLDERQIRSLAAEQRIIEYCQDADAAYFDGQYFLAEYAGRQGIGSGPAIERIDWGHSCIEDVIDRAGKCRIRRTFIGHHDPDRTWAGRIEIDRQLKELPLGKTCQVELARAGESIAL